MEDQKIKVEITVAVNYAGFNYSYDDRVQREVTVEGYHPALIGIPFEAMCASLAQGALVEFLENQEAKNGQVEN